MNLSEIKQAINKGKNVYWVQLGYQVIESKGNYYIKCISNGSLIGLIFQFVFILSAGVLKFNKKHLYK